METVLNEVANAGPVSSILSRNLPQGPTNWSFILGACFAFLFALVSVAVVAAGAFFASTEALQLKQSSTEVQKEATDLKAYHAHLAAQLETLRSTSSAQRVRDARAEPRTQPEGSGRLRLGIAQLRSDDGHIDGRWRSM